MGYRTFSFFFLALLLVSLNLHAERTPTLLERNPFVSSQFRPPEPPRPPQRPTAPPAAQDLLFQGMYQIRDEMRVLVRDRSKPQGMWITVGDAADGITAKSLDLENNKLLIVNDQGERWLELASAPDVSMAVATVAPTPAATQRGPQRIRPTTTTTRQRTTTTSTRPTVTHTRSNLQASSTAERTNRVVVPPPRPRRSVDPGVQAPSYVPPDPTNLRPPTESEPSAPPPPPPPPPNPGGFP